MGLCFSMAKTSIGELKLLTHTEGRIRCKERLLEMHIEDADWKAVMLDKWALAMLERGEATAFTPETI